MTDIGMTIGTCLEKAMGMGDVGDPNQLAAPSPSASESLDKMASFKDQMCACKEPGCAKHVSDDMTQWSQKVAKQQTEPPRMTDDETKRAAEIGTQMGECMQNAMSQSPTK